LIDIIVYLYENHIDTFSMKDIYSRLSQKSEVSIRNIKWNIEKAINSMYRFSTNENLFKIFPNYDARKPTPKYIISMALYELNKLQSYTQKYYFNPH